MKFNEIAVCVRRLADTFHRGPFPLRASRSRLERVAKVSFEPISRVRAKRPCVEKRLGIRVQREDGERQREAKKSAHTTCPVDDGGASSVHSSGSVLYREVCQAVRVLAVASLRSVCDATKPGGWLCHA